MRGIRLLLVLGLVVFVETVAGEGMVQAGSGPEETEQQVPTYQLGEIVVTDTEIPSARTATMEVITREAINNLDVRNARQAMEYTGGLYFSQTSKNETSFRLRGFEQRQVSVFLDGVPISQPYDGTVDLSQLVGDNLETIRISKDVSSTLYGANALGGTVNMITSPPGQDREARLRLEGSDHERFFTNLHLQGGIYKLQSRGFFTFEKAPDFKLPKGFDPLPNESGGRRDNSAYQKMSAGLKLLLPINPDHRVAINMNYIDNETNVPPNASVSRPRYWRFPEWIKGQVSLNSDHEFSDQVSLRTVWFYDRYHNKLQSFDDDTYTTQDRRYAFDSTYDDDTLGVLLYPRFKIFPFGITNGIFTFRHDVHRERDEEDPWREYAAQIWTVGAEQNVHLSDDLSLTAGLDTEVLRPTAAEEIALRDPIWLVNGQVSILYRLQGPFSLHGALGRKSRFPTLKELYSERLGTTIPNPYLKPERSWNTEVGMRWSGLNGFLWLSFFNNWLEDLIQEKPLGPTTGQMQNIDEARLWGMELGWKGSWERFSWSTNYTVTRAENRSQDRDSNYLEYRPVHRVNALAGVEILNGFFFHAEFSFTADQHYQDPDTGAWEELGDFALLNLRTEYDLGNHLSLYLRLNNVWDESYMSEYGVPMPGREILGGIRLAL